MPTFDVVSQVDLQEVRNAVDQAMREIVNRYDFKGTDTKVWLENGGTAVHSGIAVESASDHRVEAAIDVLQTKLVRRGVALKALSGGEIKPAVRGRSRADFTLNEGIAQDAAKELSKHVRDLGLKVQVQVQGDQLRIQGKKRDELQSVIAELKRLDYRLPLQYVNFRD